MNSLTKERLHAWLRRKAAKHTTSLKMEPLEDRRLLATLPQLVALTEVDSLYTSLDEITASRSNATSYLAPTAAVPFAVETADLRSALSGAPLEFTDAAESPLQFSIPAPDGTLSTFAVVESPVMHPELAARYPEIRTYRGQGIDNPSETIRFDVTPQGLHAQVLSPDGAFYVDPYYHLDSSVYVSYARSDSGISEEALQLRQGDREIGIAEDGVLVASGQENESIDVGGGEQAEWNDADNQLPILASASSEGGGGFLDRTGQTLRTYRLANAATIEYTNFHGGTKAAGLAAIVTAINRVSGVYETELTIRMELVANNDDLVFTNSTGDPYTNGNGFAMLGQNQSTIDNTIGNANYDIGHVFSTGGGGVAGLGVVGRSGRKAEGVTGQSVPINDPFYIDYVAHEMGHQYGGSHTFNGDSGSCAGGNRSASSAYEPGSGSTIQAYAGICGNDNLQNGSDPYFHSRSLDQIINYVDSVIPAAGTRTATGNTVPEADAGPNYEIPAGTPFLLTGVGTDADGDALTYNWEQRDLGPARDLNAADNGTSPLFRSRLATESPSRFFPREQNLLADNYTQGGERLPTLTRRMDFRLTVRDNVSGGGAVDTDNMWVDINDTGAPFQVTNQDSGVIWLAGDTQTITWDVAGTNSGQVNTPNVDIILSDDGGFTYSIPLANSVPNNGTYTFIVPNIPDISQARLMVKGTGNIFFDINDTNFGIISDDTAPPSALANTLDVTSSGASSYVFTVTYTDNQAVDASDIGPGDVEVTGPNGTVIPVNFLTKSSSTDATPITATYQIAAPGGSWDFADNGTYVIRLLAGEVSDIEENVSVTDEIIGSFEVTLSTPLGDFDLDGDLDCDDVNMLTTAIASGTNDPAFDVTGEGVLNNADLTVWVEDLKGTLMADANLDFTVDGADFLIWNSNKFSTGTAWCSGDFNADGETDGADFLIWNTNKFQSIEEVVSPPMNSSASTEPGFAAKRNVMERRVPVAPPTAVRGTRTISSHPAKLDSFASVESVRRQPVNSDRDLSNRDGDEDWPTMVEQLFAADLG